MGNLSPALLRKLKEAGILKQDRVVLKSGKVSDYYVNVKKAYGSLDLLSYIAHEMYFVIRTSTTEKVTCIVSQGYGGIPLAVMIAANNSIPHLTFVRESPKGHGLEGILDGHVPNSNDIVAIVDDVGTSGQSLRNCIQSIRPFSARIIGCYTVVKRGDFELPYGIPYKYLFTPEDFRD